MTNKNFNRKEYVKATPANGRPVQIPLARVVGSGEQFGKRVALIQILSSSDNSIPVGYVIAVDPKRLRSYFSRRKIKSFESGTLSGLSRGLGNSLIDAGLPFVAMPEYEF